MMNPEDISANLDNDSVRIRQLTAGDLDRVVAIDEASTGLRREDFFRKRIARSLDDSSVHLSLAAEVDGTLVGFLAVSFFFGEFGRPEPTAVLDSLGVHPDFRGQKIAQALMQQVEMNLVGLRVERIRTEVAWDQFELLGFFASAEFEPTGRLILEKRLMR